MRAVSWFSLLDSGCLAKLQLLFFGGVHQDLSAFVLRDLGWMTFERYEVQPELGPFRNREALQEHLEVRAVVALSDAANTLPGLVPGLLQRLAGARANRATERVRSRALNHFGRQFERAGEFEKALTLLRRQHTSTRHVSDVCACSQDWAGKQKPMRSDS